MADDNNSSGVRVGTADVYGHGAPGKAVQFPGELAMRPGAHLPGQPVYRVNQLAPATNVRLQLAPVRPEGVLWLRMHAGAVAPRLGTGTAAGYDLSTPEAITVKPGERVAIPLGFALGLPEHLHGRIESRSGLALKGLVVLTGVIDADYRGEVKVIMQNFSSAPYEFAAGDRVAQLVLRHTVHAPFTAVDSLDETPRGTGGFGSTGS